MSTPEPCIKGRCYSPTACNGWGYCRERNEGRGPTVTQVQKFRDQVRPRADDGAAMNSSAPHPWTGRPDEEIEWLRSHARDLRRHENMAKWAAKYERVVCHIENIEAEITRLRART